ncbi:hypothetical protein ACXYMU_03780 [Pontibacter sp. CAU 1760]
MKKYIYVVASVAALSFTACDPMEDVYEELDAQISNEYEADIKTELAAKDYEFYKGKSSAPAYVAKNHYFGSEAEAGALIPAILDKNFPQVGNGTKAAIGYNKLLFKFGGNKINAVEEYSVTERSDYQLGGARYSNFDRESQVLTFLGEKFPEAVDGTLAVLDYTWYNGSAEPRNTDVTDSYYFTNGAWVDAYHVSEADYVAVGRNRFNNFTSADDAVLADYFNRFLNASVVGNKPGDVKYVSYAYYNGKSTKQEVMAMNFNGTRWVELEEDLTENAVIKFKKKNAAWVADLSIAYSLVAADYTWISEQSNISTEANRSNLARYGNFNTFSWSNDDIIFAMAELLKSKFPGADAGQKYTVTYDTYPTGLIQSTLIKRDNGNFELLGEGE